jgi:hypothetical protein
MVLGLIPVIASAGSSEGSDLPRLFSGHLIIFLFGLFFAGYGLEEALIRSWVKLGDIPLFQNI